ncbi:MAG: EAL domain-containing protein [Lachnospiraceae bacterium]|nr:EAL domain-containing protein [Lachnospiraceae bacterium]
MKKRVIAAILLLVLCCGLFVPGTASAAEGQVIRVGYIDEKGFIEQKEDGTYYGYMVEYLNKISEYTGWEYEFIFGTWEGNLEKLEKGELDFVFNAQYTAEREEKYYFSSYPIGLECSYLYARMDDTEIYFNDFSSMEGKKVALLKGTFQTMKVEQFAQNIGWEYEAVFCDNDAEILESLKSGKADLLASGSLSAHNDLKRVGIFGAAEYYAITGKRNGKELLSELDWALGELQTIYPDYQMKLRERYYGDSGYFANAEISMLTKEEKEYLQSCKTLRVAIPDNEYPLSDYNETTGSYEGIYVDLLHILSQNSGLQFELVTVEQDAWGDYDLRFGQAEESVETEYYVTIPCMNTYAIGISHENKELNMESELKVALPVTNRMLYLYFLDNFPQYELIRYDSTEECLDAVLSKNVDVAIQDKYVMTYLAQQPVYSELMILPTYSIQGNIGFIVPKKTDALLRSILNKTILTITDEQEKELQVNYTQIAHYEMSVKQFFVKYRTEIIAAVVGIIAAWFLVQWIGRRNVEKKMLQQEAEHLRLLAEHDILTGLYNRQMFYAKARELVEGAVEPYDIVTINMEHFKVVNELYGTQEGDRILIRLAEILGEELQDSKGVSGRLAADNFVVCMPTAANTPEFRRSIQDKIKEYPLNIRIAIRFGIYHIKDTTREISNMCDKANLAADSIKNNYHINEATYSGKHREKMLSEQGILNDMDEALGAGHFLMYLQPKNLLENGKIVGCEALVRWKHPERGMISPGEFIPIFEQNGFITRLDHYIWEEACKFIRYCMDNNYPVIPVSVNVSRMNFYDLKVADYLKDLVKKYDIDPKYLELEVTESAYIGDANQLFNTQKELQDSGFRFLMDDFGSGYSSLNTLKDLPVDVLKLDLRFLQTEKVAGRSKIILSSVMHMAQELQMPVIAEGLETEEQLQLLRKIGCKTGQGYYFSKPVSVEEFLQLLKAA